MSDQLDNILARLAAIEKRQQAAKDRDIAAILGRQRQAELSLEALERMVEAASPEQLNALEKFGLAVIEHEEGIDHDE